MCLKDMKKSFKLIDFFMSFINYIIQTTILNTHTGTRTLELFCSSITKY